MRIIVKSNSCHIMRCLHEQGLSRRVHQSMPNTSARLISISIKIVKGGIEYPKE